MIERIKRFEAKSKKNKRITYYIVYTILFLAIVPVVFLQFNKSGMSFVWFDDAIYQHFPALTYFAKILRQSFVGIINGRVQFPLWDFSIGPGMDIITTLNYYGVGDPLNLLTVFVPLAKMELGYAFLIILRIYLAGVTFSTYCNEMKCGRWNTLCGAFAYAFCGYALYAGVRHPFFLNPMIILPLLLLGIEKIFKKKKPYVFILSVFYAAITGVYFFYMLGIMAGIYFIIRCWSFCEGNKIKRVLSHIGNFAIYTATGILLSGILFIHNIIGLLSSTRMRTEHVVETFFNPNYYWHAPISFLSSFGPGAWSFMGYVSLVAIGIFMMFSYRRKYTQLKIGFIILSIMLCIPYAGHIMNGFSYVANRWIWGYGFLLAFIMTMMLPKIVKMDAKRFKALLVVASIYLSYVAWFLLGENTTARVRGLSKLAIIQYSIVLVVLILSFAWSYVVQKKDAKTGMKRRHIVIKIALLLTVIVNIFLQSKWYYSPQGYNYVAEFLPSDTVYNRQTEVANVVGVINDNDSFYRYSENAYDTGFLPNGALVSQINSNALYFSLVDENYVEYMEEMACNDIVDPARIKGLDSRVGLNAIAGTKYYITETNKESYVPYGYTKLFVNGRFSAYKNEHSLPLGYTYRNYIQREEYELLSTVQKEHALLQGVILDEKAANLQMVEPEKTVQKLDFGLKCKKGVTASDGKFVVTKKNAIAVIDTQGLADSETFLTMSNLKYQPPKGKEESLSRAIIEIEDEGTKNTNGQAVVKKIDIRTPYYTWYVDRHNFTVNMGYSKEAKNQLIIKFTQKGEYTFDEMEIICQPMTDYATKVAKLKEETLENVVIGTNKVNGTINLEETKFLCMSIPYSKGWTLYVDGEKRELLRANTAYMGVELEAGHHEIELRYFTPYLKMSIMCTIVGMMLFAGIVILDKRKRKSVE